MEACQSSVVVEDCKASCVGALTFHEQHDQHYVVGSHQIAESLDWAKCIGELVRELVGLRRLPIHSVSNSPCYSNSWHKGAMSNSNF